MPSQADWFEGGAMMTFTACRPERLLVAKGPRDSVAAAANEMLHLTNGALASIATQPHQTSAGFRDEGPGPWATFHK